MECELQAWTIGD